MTDPRHIKVVFGAMAHPIRRQLREQGIRMTTIQAKYIQAELDAVTTLAIGQLITDAEKRRIRQRFMRALSRRVKDARLR